MFTAGEMQLIRKNCPKDFESLLRSLSISNPDFASGDEYRIYEKLDNELEKKIGRLMKSPSAVEGYTKLLNLGGVAYNYSELDNELLAKVVANKDKIMRGLENLPKFIEVEVPPQNIIQPPPQPKKIKKTELRTEVSEKHFTLYKPIILGAILIGAGLFLLGIGGVVMIILGIISAFLGAKGKTVRTEKTVPVVKEIEVTPPPTPQSVRQAPVRKEVKPPFTRNELQKVLDVLAQVNKIVRAI